MGLVPLTDLDPREYEHPADQRTLDLLQQTRGVDTLVKKFYEFGIERIVEIQCTGSNLEVTASSFPRLHEMLEAACATLHLMHLPRLYLHHSEDIQGLTTGVDRPTVLLATACVDDLSDAETRFVLGRQIGHIKSRHVLYYEIGTLMPVLSEVLAAPTLGLSALVTAPLQVALLHWMRMSEYTADRAGLLACQDTAAAASALAKVAGLPRSCYDAFNVDDFVAQARAFEGFDADKLNKVLKFASLTFGEQQWAVARAHELLCWVDDGHYKRVLDRETKAPDAPAAPSARFCTACGSPMPEGGRFCTACGQEAPA